MTFRGVQIKERGVNFAVVVVPDHVIVDQVEGDRMMVAIRSRIFRGIPVVLMAEELQGTPIYYGRADLVRLLESVDMSRLHWAEYKMK